MQGYVGPDAEGWGGDVPRCAKPLSQQKDSIKPGIMSRNLLETRYKLISRCHLLTDKQSTL